MWLGIREVKKLFVFKVHLNSAFDIASYMYMYFSLYHHIGLHGKQKSSDLRDKTSFPTNVSGGINIVLFAIEFLEGMVT